MVMSHLTMIKNKFQGLCKMVQCRMACTTMLPVLSVECQFHNTCISINTAVRTCTVRTVPVPQHLHLHQYCCQNLHCHRSQTFCLPSRILISLTPFSTKVLAAARPAMPAPTIITWQKFIWSSTGPLGIWQL